MNATDRSVRSFLLCAVVGVVITTALAGCASGAATSARNPGLAALPTVPGALIRMQHGSCSSGSCPVYQVSIFMDGTFVYDGLTNVAQVGRRTGRLSVEQLNNLLLNIQAIGFLDQPDECCVCSTTDGSQLVVVEYHPGTAQKIVVHDERCDSAPPGIGAFEMMIARETAIARWVAPQASATAMGESSVPPAEQISSPGVAKESTTRPEIQ